MSDYPEKPWDPAAGSTRPDEEERPKLREINDDVLEAQLKKHNEWLGSVKDEEEEVIEKRLRIYMEKSTWDERPGANLQKTILEGVKLQGTELQKTKLQWANFRKANLQRADFRRAELHHTLFFKCDLRKADLRDANLAKADLQQADLREAQLLGANLREADLRDADLRDVTGLLGKQLAGANVSGAKLPDDIAEFKGLDHISEISRNARNIFLAVIGGCVFSWLTIAATSDVALLTNTASTPLPIIQTKVPIAGFYLAAPLILLSLYIYLHMYLQRLWSGLAGLPAIFPDGRSLEERAYPWLLTSLVGKYVPRLKEGRPPFSRQQVFLSILTAWCLVPGTIAWFWLRYLPIHDWIGTGAHIALVVLAVTLGVGYFWRAQATLRGRQLLKFAWKIPRSLVPYAHVALALGLAEAAIVVSDGAINGNPPDRAKLSFHRLATPFGAIEIPLDHRNQVPKAYQFARSSAFLELFEAEVSIKPSSWTGLEKDNLESQIAQVKKARLSEMDLRYANARRAFLVKADLSYANLAGANLSGANLQEGSLFRANLQGADLIQTNLQNANLWEANLQEADLRDADLQGADLRVALLRGADLRGAFLPRADLRGAEGLTQEQLDDACGDMNTKLPKGLKDYKMNPCPEAGN